MLSVQKCRRILGEKTTLKDKEIEELRDVLYALARIVVNKEKRGNSTNGK